MVTRSGGDRSMLGMALLAAGTLWLLGELGLLHVAGRTLASVALVCIGAGLIMTRRTGRRRWPILVGGLLALSLLGNSASASFRSQFGGTVGPQTASPTQLSQVRARYQTAAGALTVDLSGVGFPPGGHQAVDASVGAGPLHVIVPADVALRVKAHDSAGPVTVLGRQLGAGLDENDEYQDPDWGRTSRFRLTLDLHVGAGPIDVERTGAAKQAQNPQSAPAPPLAPKAPQVPVAKQASDGEPLP